MGDAATSFDLLEGYYFSKGAWASLAPAGGDQDRLTSALFQPPMHDLWRTPQFDDLLRRIGLTAYWTSSRTLPDFKRNA